MGSATYHVLFVGNIQPTVFNSEKTAIEPAENDIQFYRVAAYQEAIQLMKNGQWDAVLISQDFDDHSGLELIHHARLLGSIAPLILLSDVYDDSLDYKARKIGAADLVSMCMLDIPYLRHMLGQQEKPSQSNRRKYKKDRFQKKLLSVI